MLQEVKLNHIGKIWIQVIKGEVSVNGYKIAEGDGLASENEESLNIRSGSDSEFLLFIL